MFSFIIFFSDVQKDIFTCVAQSYESRADGSCIKSKHKIHLYSDLLKESLCLSTSLNIMSILCTSPTVPSFRVRVIYTLRTPCLFSFISCVPLQSVSQGCEPLLSSLLCLSCGQFVIFLGQLCP